MGGGPAVGAVVGGAVALLVVLGSACRAGWFHPAAGAIRAHDLDRVAWRRSGHLGDRPGERRLAAAGWVQGRSGAALVGGRQARRLLDAGRPLARERRRQGRSEASRVLGYPPRLVSGRALDLVRLLRLEGDDLLGSGRRRSSEAHFRRHASGGDEFFDFDVSRRDGEIVASRITDVALGDLRFDIVRMHADGSGFRTLTKRIRNRLDHAVWSPDGTKIASLSSGYCG